MDKDISLKFKQLFQSRVDENSPDFLFTLARFDLTLTTTINVSLDSPEAMYKQDLNENSNTDMSEIFTKQNLDTEFDTLVLSLLHEINGNFSTILKFDDSLLKSHNSWRLLTRKLKDKQRSKFLSTLIELRAKKPQFNNLTRTPSTGLLMGNKIYKILNCFKNHFHVNFCVSFLKCGELTRIKCMKSNSLRIQNVFLTKKSSKCVFSAIVCRRRIHQDQKSYLISVANDILKFKPFQSSFDSFAKLKCDSKILDSEVSNIYVQLLNCSSIEEIVDLILQIDSTRHLLHPLNILVKLINDKHLDSAIHREVLALVKTNIQSQINFSGQILSAEELQEHRTSYDTNCQIEANAPVLIQEAKEFRDAEEKRIEEIKKEIESIESNQEAVFSKMSREKSEEIIRIQTNISQTNGYIAWIEFNIYLAKVELEKPEFVNFDLSSFATQNPKPTLECIIKTLQQWFKVPTEILFSPHFEHYIRQNKADDCTKILKLLSHLQQVNIPESNDSKQPLEIFGRHLILSNVLRKIYERKFSELRIIASGTLILDTDITLPGINVLLRGDNIVAPKKLTIDTSGQHGESLIPDKINPEKSKIAGGEGLQGNPGASGSSAGHVILLASHPIMNLDNLHIKSDGGNGANGQNGGAGGDGESGKNGEDGHMERPGKTKVWHSLKFLAEGTAGAPGKPGGKRGKPGLGGIAGSCGKIIINCGDLERRYMNESIGNFSCLNGRKGNDGCPGDPGDHGQGGIDGSDHGYATESFFFWDEWKDEQGKLKFEKVNGWFKGGYKITVLKTKSQVHETRAQAPKMEQQDISENILPEYQMYKYIAPNKEICLNSKNLKLLIKSHDTEDSNSDESDGSKLNRTLQSMHELEAQLASISNDTNDKREYQILREQMSAKERDLRRCREIVKLHEIQMSTWASNAQQAKFKKLDNLNAIKEMESCLQHLKELNKKFQEENKVTVQTQEQVEIKISSEFQNLLNDSNPEYQIPIQSNLERNNFDFRTTNHSCLLHSSRIMCKLKNREANVKEWFEECLQKSLFYSTSFGRVLPSSFFHIVKEQAKRGVEQNIRGYKFVEFISEILPHDLQLSMENQNDIKFCKKLKFLTKDSNGKPEDLLQKIFNLRNRIFEQSELNTLENSLENKHTIPDSLKIFLQDILERNYVEHFVEHILNLEDSRLKKIGKNIKNFVGKQKQKFWKSSKSDKVEEYEHIFSGNIVSEEPENVKQERIENDENLNAEDYGSDDDGFEAFEADEIDQAVSNAKKFNRKRQILSEDEIRHLANTRLMIYKELKQFNLTGLKLSNCLDPTTIDQFKILNENMIGKFILEITSNDIDSIKANLLYLCNTEIENDTEEFRRTANLFPLYMYIIPRSDPSLEVLNDLYDIALRINRKYNNSLLSDELYQLYIEKFQKSMIEKLNNSIHKEKYSNEIKVLVDYLELTDVTMTGGKTFTERVSIYELILNSTEENIYTNLTNQLNEIGKIEFKSRELNRIAENFNSNQTTTEFIKFLLNIVKFLKGSTSKSIYYKPLSNSFPKLCLHMKQLRFTLTELESLVNILNELEVFAETKLFHNVRFELNSRLDSVLKSTLAQIPPIFDLNGDVRKKCDEILSLIIEILTTSDLINQDKLISHFGFVLETIYCTLSKTGKFAQFEILANKIGQLKVSCCSASDLLSKLIICLIEFLQSIEEQCFTLNLNSISTNEILWKNLELILQAVECFIQKIPKKLDYSSLKYTIQNIISAFLSENSLNEVAINLLCLTTNSKMDENAKKRNDSLVKMKQILQSEIRKYGINANSLENEILNEMKSFKRILDLSTRANFSSDMYQEFHTKQKTHLDAVRKAVSQFEHTIQGIFELLKKSGSSADKSEFLILCNKNLVESNIPHLVDGQLLNTITQTFIDAFINIEKTSTGRNVCETLFNLVNQYMINTFPNIQIDENTKYEFSQEESEVQKQKRFIFTRLFTNLTAILAKHCWDYYPEHLKTFCTYMEKHYLEFLLLKTKPPRVHSTVQFFDDILKTLIETNSNSNFSESLDNVILQILDKRIDRHFLMMKILLSIKFSSKCDSVNEEEENWKCVYKVSGQELVDQEFFITNDTQFKTIISSVLLKPCSVNERTFLLRVLENVQSDFKLNPYQTQQIKLYFNKESDQSNTTNSTFWKDLFKADMLNFLTVEEKVLVKQLENFLANNETFEEVKLYLSKLIFTNTRYEWIRTIREFLADKIYKKLFSCEIQQDLKHELDALYFFILKDNPDYGEHKIISIFINICKFFEKVGTPNSYYKKMFLKYAQHITLNELERILISKLPENWLNSILKVRLLTCVKENFLDLSNQSNLVANLEKSLYDVEHSEYFQQFLIIFGDKLLNECKENSIFKGDSSHICQSLENISVCLQKQTCKQANLTKDLLEDLQAYDLIYWKTCFRRKELLEKGLLRDTCALIIIVESKISTSDMMDTFLKAFRSKFYFTENESLLHKILAKIESGEWCIDDTIKTFYSSASVNESDLLQTFENTARRNRGKDLKGKDLIKKLLLNTTNMHLADLLEKEILQDLLKITSNLSEDSDNTIFEKKLYRWTEKDIQKWSKNMKSQVKGKSLKDAFDYLMKRRIEVLSIICQAVRLNKEYIPWDTQLVSVMIFLDSALRRNGKNLGRLGQIYTGEGKTLITAMLAVFWSIPIGSTVNIITSTHILATENAIEIAPLFKMFDISVGNNCDKACLEGGDQERKKRNSNQVIYGDLSSFQSDILQTENFGKDLLSGRKVNYVFVDEADNMLLDKGGHMLYISHPISEFRHLRPIFLKIWKIINNYDNSEIATTQEKLIEKVAKELRKELDENENLIPNFLKEFVDKRILTWIKNGYQAKSLLENDPYIISDKEGKKVTIIDKDTGVEQSCMQYSFGLHQFIELKHCDKLSCENLKAIFMSNFAYFQRYSGKIYGITGTLGSDKSKNIMRKRYDVDFFCMEHHKYRYCPQEDGKVGNSEEEWLQFIQDAVLLKTKEGRAVLVIAKNVMDVRRISSFLKPMLGENLETYESSTDEKFVKYIRDNSIPPDKVIVGTNLAGRGTDLKITDEVKNAGGLHVILTYIPSNSRVEAQAFGRAGRKGEPGSTQFVVLCMEEGVTIEQLRNKREQKENDRLDQMNRNQFDNILLEENLFKKFQTYIKIVTKCKKPETLMLAKNIRQLHLQFIRNRWALWLDSMHETIKLWRIFGEEIIMKKFTEFENETNEAIKTKKLAQFPSELVKLAKGYEENNNMDMAIDHLSDAVDKDRKFAEIPLYYKAYCILKKSPNEITSRKKSIQLLKQARVLLKSSIARYEGLPGVLDVVNKGNGKCSKNFSKQMEHQCELLKKHLKSIDAAVGVPINDHLFLQVSGVSEMAEAQELLTKTINESNFLKKFRISKKVQFRNDEILVNNKKIELPVGFSYCYKELQNIISEHQKKTSSLDCLSSLTQILTSKEEFWEKLHNNEAFESIECTNHYRIYFSDEKFQTLQFPHDTEALKVPIGLILMEHNTQLYMESFLEIFDIQTRQLNHLTALLRIHNILVEEKCYKATLKNEFVAKIDFINKEYPKELKQYGSILEHYLQDVNGQVRTSIASEEIPYISKKNSIHIQASILLETLISLDIIKECKLDISLKRDFDTIDKKVKQIIVGIDSLTPNYTRVYQKYHKVLDNADENSRKIAEKDLEKGLEIYLKSIKDILKNSIGSLRLFGKIKADYIPIETNYLHTDYPHVIVEFIQSDFERLIKFSETISWCKSGGFIVTSLGILQIAVGVSLLTTSPNIAMGLISEGFGDIYYGYSVGYTNPNFSTSDFLIQKTLSVGASLITCGLDYSGGFTLKRIGMEVGEELIKRTILMKACKRVGGQVLGVVIHQCLNWCREYVFRNFKVMLMGLMPINLGYQTQIQILCTKLRQMFTLSYDTKQAWLIIKNSMDFLWENEYSVFRIALNNAVSRVVPQLLGRISSAISKAYGAAGNSILQSYEVIMTYFSWCKMFATNLKEIIDFAANSIQRLNDHLEIQIENLRLQRAQRLSLAAADTAENTYSYDESYVNTYQQCINEELAKKILEKLQEKMVEPAMNDFAQTALEYGFERIFEERRNTTLNIIAENQPKQNQPTTIPDETTNTSKIIEQGQSKSTIEGGGISELSISTLSHFSHLNMDTIVRNANGESIKRLYMEHGERLKIFEDKYGRCFADF